MNLDKSQQSAVDFATTKPQLAVITGPAGTGKTTVIKHIADNFGGDCYIMAPTGKAAARIKQVTGYEAKTCHSYLRWDGTRFHRKENFNSPVIIDEASMLDGWLLSQIIRFRPPSVVLVGDSNQLLPVGRGQPFHDLVKIEESVCRLDVNHRAKSAILHASSCIRRGEMPAAKIESGGEVWSCIWSRCTEDMMAKLIDWCKRGQFDPERDVVIAAKYGNDDNDGGIDSLNTAIRSVVNPHATDNKFQIGDRILVCKNFGEDDLWNGDTGTVRDIDYRGNPKVVIDRDPEFARDLTGAQVRETRLGYALSVHKAQGSEFRRVFFVCPDQHFHMLDRSLIYTAVTRAQEGCVVMGSRRAFEDGIGKINCKTTVLGWLENKQMVD